MSPLVIGRSGHGTVRVLGAVALIMLVAACSGPTPSPSPSPAASATAGATTVPSPGSSRDDLATYREIAAQIVAIRGLDAPSRVDPTIIDRATLQKNLGATFDRDTPPAQIANMERVDKALGLLGSGASLRDLTLALQGDQVIGYYDSTAKQLFIVSGTGGLGPTERVTYAHEFTHELQDRHFNLDGLGLSRMPEDSDRRLAALALVEGDATTAQTGWMLKYLTPDELAQIAAEASDPALLAVLASTPQILLETSLFSYQAGATFVGALQGSGGEAAVNAAFTRLPVSTEQILHPEKYAAGEGPVDVGLPADLAARLGTGWAVAARDTMGELQLRVWLKAGGLAGDVARTAADGWGGDRAAVLDGPSGATVLVLVTAWDTQADADAFQAAAASAVGGLRLDGQVVQNGTRVVVGIRNSAAPSGVALEPILAGLAGR
jgi:hypothetical protein